MSEDIVAVDDEGKPVYALAAEQLLLPCPFCGKADTAAVDTSTNIQHDVDCECRDDCEDYFAVFCDASTDSKKGGCGASGGYQKTEALAIAVWNKRAAAEPPEKQVDVEFILGQCEEGLRVSHDCPATFALAAILAELTPEPAPTKEGAQ